MNKAIFEYTDYKIYLQDWIAAQPKQGHGTKTKLAKAIHCNTTYITQVLSGPAHFSLEQAEATSSFLNHNEEETQFFLLLLQHQRAGTQSLQKFLKKQINSAIKNQFNLKNRLEYKKELSFEDQVIYYSRWYFSAIHVVLSIQSLQTREMLSRYFGLPIKTVSEVLRFLTSVGLAQENQGRYTAGPFSIHLGQDSPMIQKHHANWRIQAIQSLDQNSDNDLHYSSVVTISKQDQIKIKSILVKAIEEARGVIKASPEEEAYCYNLDFFHLKKG